MEDTLEHGKGAMVGHPVEWQFSNSAACANNPRKFKKILMLTFHPILIKLEFRSMTPRHRFLKRVCDASVQPYLRNNTAEDRGKTQGKKILSSFRDLESLLFTFEVFPSETISLTLLGHFLPAEDRDVFT